MQPEQIPEETAAQAEAADSKEIRTEVAAGDPAHFQDVREHQHLRVSELRPQQRALPHYARPALSRMCAPAARQ